MFAWNRRPHWLVWAVVATILAGSISLGLASREAAAFVDRATIGDLEVIHSRVLLGGKPRHATTRLALGDRIATQVAGRAKLWLGDGVSALLDENSELQLGANRIELLSGRLFVDSPEGHKITVVVGRLQAPVSASKVAFEHLPGGAQTKIFCAQGEVMVSETATPTRVPSGETLTKSAGQLTVLPEKAFDDWTGGLAVPWAEAKLSRSALADVWATPSSEPVTPLHINRESMQVSLDGEFATTRKRSRFYNGNATSISPLLRFALPPNAILTKVAHRISTEQRSHEADLAICQNVLSMDPKIPRLEWAGNGWVAGQLPFVPPGGSIDLELEYTEWLPASSGKVTYRSTIGRRGDSPLVGELLVEVDATNSLADTVEANQGATVQDKKLTWRAADVRPSDDWVVSYSPRVLQQQVARAYVEPTADGGDPYVMFRTETAALVSQGIELAIVVDSSRSVGSFGLELARQVVAALLGNLSERDRVIVFAADEEQHHVGPAMTSYATRATREAIVTGLAQLRPGGASHLTNALERAADALDASDQPLSSKMVVYLGDARPSLGDLTAERIRAQLQRRAQGIPRLTGIALGPHADRWLLARLVAGSGPVHSVSDRSEAGTVAASVIAAVEQATHREVGFDLGPDIDRIYPREHRAARADSTTVVVGRLRGTLPRQVQLSYRDGAGQHVQTLRVERRNSPSEGAVARSWALARIDEIMTSDAGIEPALLLAHQHRLLLPWTEWILETPQSSDRRPCSGFPQRIVELSTLGDSSYARRIEPQQPPGGGWLEPPLSYEPGQSLEQGATQAGKAKVATARTSITACRNARLGIVPNLPIALDYRVRLSATGHVDDVTINPRDSARRDSIMFGCVERVIRHLAFVGAEKPIVIDGTVLALPPSDPKRTQCSPAAALPLPLRLNLWATRQGPALVLYEQALRSCEATAWTERRELLTQLTRAWPVSQQLLDFADELLTAGHSDASDFVRNEVMRRVSTTEELKRLRQAMLANEPNLDADIAAKLHHATSDPERLAIVTRALAMAPHSPLGRRVQLLLLERMGQSAAIRREIEAVRSDPFTDAGLIALAAGTLSRLNFRAEAHRTFAELFERAPMDPWVLTFAGDQLRLEGFAEQSLLAYESLARITPNDTATMLRTGIAQAAVGRIDIATRLLDRAAQTVGRTDDHRLNELGSVLRAMVLAKSAAQAKDPAEQSELRNRLAQTALPDVAAIVLVEAPASPEQNLVVRMYRAGERLAAAPELDASPLGLAALFLDRGAESIQVEVSRRTWGGLARPMPVTLSVLTLGEQPHDRHWRQLTSTIAADQEKTILTINPEDRR